MRRRYELMSKIFGLRTKNLYANVGNTVDFGSSTQSDIHQINLFSSHRMFLSGIILKMKQLDRWLVHSWIWKARYVPSYISHILLKLVVFHPRFSVAVFFVSLSLDVAFFVAFCLIRLTVHQTYLKIYIHQIVAVNWMYWLFKHGFFMRKLY